MVAGDLRHLDQLGDWGACLLLFLVPSSVLSLLRTARVRQRFASQSRTATQSGPSTTGYPSSKAPWPWSTRGSWCSMTFQERVCGMRGWFVEALSLSNPDLRGLRVLPPGGAMPLGVRATSIYRLPVFTPADLAGFRAEAARVRRREQVVEAVPRRWSPGLRLRWPPFLPSRRLEPSHLR